MTYHKTQGSVDAYVLKAKRLSPKVDEEQLIAFVMLNFCLYYDEAKARVKQALRGIHNQVV